MAKLIQRNIIEYFRRSLARSLINNISLADLIKFNLGFESNYNPKFKSRDTPYGLHLGTHQIAIKIYFNQFVYFKNNYQKNLMRNTNRIKSIDKITIYID